MFPRYLCLLACWMINIHSLIYLQAILRVCLYLRVIFPFHYCNKVSLLDFRPLLLEEDLVDHQDLPLAGCLLRLIKKTFFAVLDCHYLVLDGSKWLLSLICVFTVHAILSSAGLLFNPIPLISSRIIPRIIFSEKNLGSLRIEPRAAGTGSKCDNHCALPPPKG